MQEAAAILGPQNRTKGRCGILIKENFAVWCPPPAVHLQCPPDRSMIAALALDSAAVAGAGS